MIPNGYLTYSSILALVIVSLFGQFVTTEEADKIAVGILTLMMAGSAIYGRFRVGK